MEASRFYYLIKKDQCKAGQDSKENEYHQRSKHIDILITRKSTRKKNNILTLKKVDGRRNELHGTLNQETIV